MLTKIEFSHIKNDAYYCKARCSHCNTITIVQDSVLRRQKSCGCLPHPSITHGKSIKVNGKPSRAYTTWSGIVQRIKSPGSSSYDRYGGRGVTMDDRWLKFENFYEDMGDPPKGLSIDRIDCNKGYSKENCRWASIDVQALNQKRVLWVRLEGFPLLALSDIRYLTGKPATTAWRYVKAGKHSTILGWLEEARKSPDFESKLNKLKERKEKYGI